MKMEPRKRRVCKDAKRMGHKVGRGGTASYTVLRGLKYLGHGHTMHDLTSMPTVKSSSRIGRGGKVNVSGKVYAPVKMNNIAGQAGGRKKITLKERGDYEESNGGKRNKSRPGRVVESTRSGEPQGRGK